MFIIHKIEIVGGCVCSLTARERIYQFAQNLACLFLETRKRIQKRGNSENLSLIRVPMNIVSVARKLSTIEERRQDQSCLFRKGDYRNKGRKPRNCSGFECR
jgi:hypothetical protein